MKKLLIAVTSLVLSSAAYAGDKVESKDPCEVWSDLAKVVMGNRQQETDLADMVKIAKDNAVALNIVKMAYSRPAYSVKKNQDNAVKRFANDVYLICLEK